MTDYKLKVTAHEPIYSEDYLDGYVSLAKDDAFRVLEKKLIESGEADDYFDNYMEKPYPKLWEEPKMVSADYAVEEWFNDSNDVDKDYSFARSVYNSTIHKPDIEVTFDRDYCVDLDGDTFVAHVNDTWDELGKNAEAIQLLKENDKLGQKYVDMYLSNDASKEFKQAFESVLVDDYGVDLESLSDSADFGSNLIDLIDELDINWRAEEVLNGLYSSSLQQHIESVKRKNRVQYKQIEYFMKNLLKELPESERSKVEKQIYYYTRKNSPHFLILYKSDMGAAQCWVTDGYLSGCAYHDGDVKPCAVHADTEKFVGSLESFANSLADNRNLVKLPI